MILHLSRKWLVFGLLVLTLPTIPAQADDSSECQKKDQELCESVEDSIEPVITRNLGGPEQVENRLYIDSNQVTPMFPSNFARGYFDWKDRIKEENGIGIGGDYSLAYLKSSDSPGVDDAFGGMYRFFGSWEAFSDGEGNSGALIWKVEHRHAYGGNIPPGKIGRAHV
jgi:hypothetical protein